MPPASDEHILINYGSTTRLGRYSITYQSIECNISPNVYLFESTYGATLSTEIIMNLFFSVLYLPSTDSTLPCFSGTDCEIPSYYSHSALSLLHILLLLNTKPVSTLGSPSPSPCFLIMNGV